MTDFEKIRLRQRFMLLREKLSAAERSVAEAKIADYFLSLPEVKRARHIGFYCSYGTEVETRTLMTRALQMEKNVYLPKVVPANKQMWFSAHDGDFEGMAGNVLGIMEPQGAAVDHMILELLVIPGVAFDASGNRLGHGAGYYDRFLKKTSAPKIGLAFEKQVCAQLPTGPHDVRIDALITEAGVRRFGQGLDTDGHSS